MNLETFIQKMPKAELHVHLEGSILPETLLELARRYKHPLPADTLEGLREWYQFKDFTHFIEVYKNISACLHTADDLELITRDFLRNQARQNIRYSEVTFTAYTHYDFNQIPFADQITAINRARKWGEEELGVSMQLVIDIDRQMTAEDAEVVGDWVLERREGVLALGLGGPEVGHPPERFTKIFQRVSAAGIPCLPHAGETEGPASIWGALRSLNAQRIGHGVRCLEDPQLVEYLREKQIPLDVCPTSNICLGVFESFEQHPLPKLLEEGLYVTINSDDPPMFSTTLTDEYLKISKTFGFGAEDLKKFVMNALNVSFAPNKAELVEEFEKEFELLK